MRINECSIGISRLKWNVIKSYEGLLGDTTKFPHDETEGVILTWHGTDIFGIPAKTPYTTNA